MSAPAPPEPEATTIDPTRPLPATLTRVVFLQGYGWPRCYKRTEAQRTYTRDSDAARMVATILALPSHHRLLGVYRTSCSWEPCTEEVVAAAAAVDTNGVPDADEG